jgi:hypothetical protein
MRCDPRSTRSLEIGRYCLPKTLLSKSTLPNGARMKVDRNPCWPAPMLWRCRPRRSLLLIRNEYHAGLSDYRVRYLPVLVLFELDTVAR